MSLSIGIVGLPNVGKSTLFNALTSAGILAANYPFATIEPNTGVVPVPDERVAELASILGSGKATLATVTFVDIAGLVAGASKGEGLGNRFLANIREVDAICHVVRAFESPNVSTVGDADPQRDIETIETELALADLETVEKRLTRLEKEATVDKKLQPKLAAVRKAHSVLSSGGILARDASMHGSLPLLEDLHLLTAKPVIFVFNIDTRSLGDSSLIGQLTQQVAPARALFLDAQIEAEVAELDEPERTEMLESIGLERPGLHTVIEAAYDTLGLQSFLTGGEKESRAWTIKRGSTAPEAAGVIHTDFQRGFIAAEVIHFPLLKEAGSWASARSRGLVRTEGKSYVMHPDDVAEFRFNV